jgi:hypothetical protein
VIDIFSSFSKNLNLKYFTIEVGAFDKVRYFIHEIQASDYSLAC